MTPRLTSDARPEPLARSSGQPPEIPFTLDLGTEIEPVRCERQLRHLPGRRWVGCGLWAEQPVFVKLFEGSARAKVHWQREIAGARALTERAIPTPELLHSQALSANRYVNIYELVQRAESGSAARLRARREGQELALLKRLVAVVATHHEAGIWQRDLHLDNLVVDPAHVWTVDGGCVRAFKRPLSLRRACLGAGTLLAQFDPMDDTRAESLLRHYCAIRGLEADTIRRRVTRARDRIRRYRLHATVEKAFRNSTAFAVQRVFGWRRIWDRGLVGDELTQLVQDPNAYLDAYGEIIKPGNTCTVWRTRADKRSLVVKRYNLKNRRHAMNRSMRRSRGSRAWENAMRLRFLGLPTPRPVALVEQRWGPLRRTNWLVMDWVDGVEVGQFLGLDTVPAEHKRRVANELLALLRLMANSGLSHGDTKASNYLIVDGCPVIIDLDPVQSHRFRWSLQQAHKRDLERFRRNWSDQTWALCFGGAISTTEISWEGHCWDRVAGDCSAGGEHRSV